MQNEIQKDLHFVSAVNISSAVCVCWSWFSTVVCDLQQRIHRKIMASKMKSCHLRTFEMQEDATHISIKLHFICEYTENTEANDRNKKKNDSTQRRRGNNKNERTQIHTHHTKCQWAFQTK